MSKWIDNNRRRNIADAEARKGKLKMERDEYEYNYRDFPYERYLRAMERRAEEIEELDAYINDLRGDKTELEDYKDAVKHLRELLGKVAIIANYIDPCDRISDDNVKKLISLTRNYRDDFIDSGMFESQARHGNW